jgi:hypothetical protein
VKTIAQQLNIKEFPFVIKDLKGNEIYYERSSGYWSKTKYDSNGREIYYGDSKGFWFKREYDSNGNQIYYENSDGEIIDIRPKQIELTLDEIANKFGINVSQLKIKK